MADGQTLGTAVLDLRTDQSGLRQGLEDAERQTRGWSSTMVGLASKATLGLAAVGTAATVMGFSFNNMKEQSLLAFGTMQGSMQKAQQHWADLTRFAATTPFEMGQLVDASKMLQAFRFEADQVIPMLTNIGDAVAATGGDLNRVVVALGQMQLKGKVSAQEMMQLAENNVGAWNYVAEGFGKTTAEVQKMAEQGLIPAAEAIPMILEGMNREFGGLMEAQSRTFGGMISNVKDSVNVALGEITGPLFERASGGLERLVSALSSARFDEFTRQAAGAFDTILSGIERLLDDHGPALRAFATDVVGALVTTFQRDVVPAARAFADVFRTAVWPAIQSVAGAAAPLLGTLQGLVGFIADNKELLAAAAAAWVTYKAAMLGAELAMKAVTLAQKVWAAMQTAGAVISLASQVRSLSQAWMLLNMVMVANPIGIVAVAIAGLVAAGVLLWRNWDTVKEKAGALFGFLRDGFGRVTDFISEKWWLVIALLGPAGAVLVAFVKFKDEIFGVMGAIAEGIGKAIGWMIDRFNDLIDKIGDVLETARKIPGNPLGVPEQILEGGLGGIDLSGIGGLFDGLRGRGGGSDWAGAMTKGSAISAASTAHEIAKLQGALVGGPGTAGGGLAGAAAAAGAAETKLADERKRLLEAMASIHESFQRRELDAYYEGGMQRVMEVRGQNARMLADTKALAEDLHQTFGLDLPTALEEAFAQVERAAERMKNAARQAADAAGGLATSWNDDFLRNFTMLAGQGITDPEMLIANARALAGPMPIERYLGDVNEALRAGLISAGDATSIVAALQGQGRSADPDRDAFRQTLGLGVASVNVTVGLGPDLVVTGSP